MSATLFKICGVRRAEDLAACVAAGAWAVGFNFYPPSPRCLTLAEAERLAAHVPPTLARVVLSVNAPVTQALDSARAVEAHYVQWHGELSEATLGALEGLRVIWALPALPDSLARVAPVADRLAAVLLDAAVPGQLGGTGQVADWTAAAALREALAPLPVILAGGLRPGNVQEAIHAVQPWAVDVASGVESAPGVKAAELIRAFGEGVRRA